MRAHARSLTLAAVLLTATGVDAQWRELGPMPISGSGSGRIAAVAGHPTNADLIYVATATGGLWKREGTTWTPLTDQLPAGATGALAIDAADPNILYVGSGEPNAANHSFYGRGLYKSTDGGVTWNILGIDQFDGRTFARIVIAPGGGQTLFAATMQAGGTSAHTAGRGHPGAMGPVGIFKSTDAGATWMQVAGGLPAVDGSGVEVNPADGNSMVAAIGAHFGDAANGIYRSTDAGATWVKATGGPASSVGRIALAMAPSDGQRLYAMAAGAGGGSYPFVGAWTSTDGGTTWTEIDPGLNDSQALYNNVIGVDPTNPDVAYFGGTSMVRTTDGGSSFSQISPGHSDNHAVGFTASGDLLIGGDGGLYHSTDQGGDFQSMNQGFGNIQFYGGVSIHPDDPEAILGGLQDNGTVLRNQSGDWESVFGADGGYTEIIPGAPNVMFLQSQGIGNLRRSTNSGQSFSGAASGISGSDRVAFYGVIAADPNDVNRVLFATQRVYESTDQGAAWTAISEDVTTGDPHAIRAMAIAPTDSNVVWVATNDDNIQLSTDGGRTFSIKLSDAPGWERVTRELEVPAWDPLVAYVAGARFDKPQVRRTKDQGATWESIVGNLPNVPVGVIDSGEIAGTKVLIAGSDGGVFISCDDGVKWGLLGVGFPNTVVQDLHLDVPHNRVVVGTMGRGVWVYDGPALTDCDNVGGMGGGGMGGTGGAGTGGGGSGGDAGTGGGAGMGGAGGVGGAGMGGGGAGGTGATGGAGTGGLGGTEGLGGTDSGDPGGCGCRAASGTTTLSGLAALAACSALLRRRRRVRGA